MAQLAQTEDLFTQAREEFAVTLDIFSGPFEVLLSLISRKKLDVTEVALAQVTDEFLAFVAAQAELDLSQASEFLVIAATLLDLKAARLLPREEENEELLELFEARDLLFAKLLQYRAFKEVALDFARRLSEQSLAKPRSVLLEEQFRKALPELKIEIGPEDLARYAARALSRKDAAVSFEHLHEPLVPVETQVEYIKQQLIIGDRISFSQLCANARNIPTVVSRFLAILELLRAGELRIEQESALSPLYITRINVKEAQE
ncbi:MAG: ScpA family protein [Arcanobacterium sp.]|nr:ScpA family protein [Arcanobacterium sp.]